MYDVAFALIVCGAVATAIGVWVLLLMPPRPREHLKGRRRDVAPPWLNFGILAMLAIIQDGDRQSAKASVALFDSLA